MASVNDVVIKIATVNGTGSASANGLLRKAIFRMGVPVVGKNYFPSNIQGLPTWYEIRVTGKNYHCRSDRVDFMVAMNAQTYAHDLAEVEPGGCFIYDSTWPRSSLLNREDITIIGIPLSKMCNEHFEGARARILMKNIAYVGAIAALLDVDLDIIKGLLEETFAEKQHLIASNTEAIHIGLHGRSSRARCRLVSRRWMRPKGILSLMAIPQRGLAACTRARPSVPGTRLRRRHRSWTHFECFVRAIASSLKRVNVPTPLSRPRTNWPPLVWCWAQAGWVRARSHRPAGQAFRS